MSNLFRLFSKQDQINELKNKMSSVLAGGESVPSSIDGGMEDGEQMVDIHVPDETVNAVRLSLNQMYGALLAISTPGDLAKFKDCYCDPSLCGAHKAVPYVSDLLELLEFELGES